jgi:hypothetical protein
MLRHEHSTKYRRGKTELPYGIASAYGGIEKAGQRAAQAAERIAKSGGGARDLIELKRAKHAARANAKVAKTIHDAQGVLIDRRV